MEWEKVYLLQELERNGNPSGHYKIGKTTVDVEKRKQQYKAGNVRHLKTLGFIEVADCDSVERALHARFDAYWIKGEGGGVEWFDFSGLDLDSVIAIFNEYEEIEVYEPEVDEPVVNQTRETVYRGSYSSDDSGMGWVAFGVMCLVAVFFYGQWKNQNAIKSNPGDDRKVSPGEVYQYKQLNNILTQGGVKDASYTAIADHYRQIANETQVTCIKRYALEMEEAAITAKGGVASEASNQFFQADWNVYQKYVTGGCDALKALESLSGMHHLQPLIKP